MSLIVRIYINETEIKTGHAQRKWTLKRKPKDDEICIYRLHNGNQVTHRYGDGAVVLAKKILEEMA